MQTTTQHAFETAGLGKAPFRYLGMRDTAAGMASDGTVSLGTDEHGNQYRTTPGGTCAYCGKAITVLCGLESADGNRFHVGSDCVKKAGDRGMIRKVNSDNSERARAREVARIVKARGLVGCEKVQSFLSSHAHPNAYMARQGKTWLDYVTWSFDHAGHAGKMRSARLVERVLAGKQKAPKWS